MPAKEDPGGGSFGAASTALQIGGGAIFITSFLAKGNGIGLALGGTAFVAGVGLGIANMKK